MNKENICPNSIPSAINRSSSGVFTAELHEKTSDHTTSTLRPSTPTGPNDQGFYKFYSKLETLLNSKEIGADDLFDKIEEAYNYTLNYVTRPQKDKNLVYIWNQHDYAIFGELMNLISFEQVMQKYLDNFDEIISGLKAIGEELSEKLKKIHISGGTDADAKDSVSILKSLNDKYLKDRRSLEVGEKINLENIFALSYKTHKDNFPKRFKFEQREYPKHARSKNQLQAIFDQGIIESKEIKHIAIIQSLMSMNRTLEARKYLIHNMINSNSNSKNQNSNQHNNQIGNKVLYSIKTSKVSILPQLRPLLQILAERHENWLAEKRAKIREMESQNEEVIKAIVCASKSKSEQQMNFNSNNDCIVVNNKKYLKLKLLGKGGFSKVYKVFDQQQKSEFALKVIDTEGADQVVIDSFNNEVEALEILKDCKNIINLIDHQITPLERYIILECGETDLLSFIKERIAEERKLQNQKAIKLSDKIYMPFSELKILFQHMVRAVNSMHKNGMIHLDLKPANFILVKGIVKLIDFGIANKLQTEDHTSMNMETSAGTPNYMAPEQIIRNRSATLVQTSTTSGTSSNGVKRGYRVGKKTDVWSLGCILHFMAFSETPYHNIKNQQLKFKELINFKKEVPVRTSKYELLNRILKDKIFVKDVTKRATTDELLADDFFVDEMTNFSLMNNTVTQTQTDTGLAVSQRYENSQLLDMGALTPHTKRQIQSLLKNKTIK